MQVFKPIVTKDSSSLQKNDNNDAKGGVNNHELRDGGSTKPYSWVNKVIWGKHHYVYSTPSKIRINRCFESRNIDNIHFIRSYIICSSDPQHQPWKNKLDKHGESLAYLTSIFSLKMFGKSCPRQCDCVEPVSDYMLYYTSKTRHHRDLLITENWTPRTTGRKGKKEKNEGMRAKEQVNCGLQRWRLMMYERILPHITRHSLLTATLMRAVPAQIFNQENRNACIINVQWKITSFFG